MKTAFGTFKCPRCLYDEGKFNPPMPAKKNSDINSELHTKDDSSLGAKKAHWYGRGDGRKRRGGAQKGSGIKCAIQDISDPLLHFTQKDVTELADIISSPATRRAARLAAIRALGRWGDPRALEVLSSFTNHPDIDNRRYAREAIESIRLRHGA